MGGTGKTPHTIFLAQHFAVAGEKVAILSRGYKGKLGYGVNIISDGEQTFFTPPLAADEPYMMALSLPGVPVITGKNRNDSFTLAKKIFNPTIVLLDDGFQHKKMHRDIDIVLLDYQNPLSTGFPFPFGYLREFPSGLKRANIIIFTRAESNTIPEKVKKYVDGKHIFFSNTEYAGYIAQGSRIPLDYMRGKKAYAVSGIAHYAQFENQLTRAGLHLAGTARYKDHHAFSEQDIKKILTNASCLGAEVIITTHKDFVKIPEEYQSAFIYPDMRLKFNNGNIINTINSLRTSGD